MDSVKMSAEFKFPEVFCSQCGQTFGPGDNGFSHCEGHAELFSTEGGFYGPADWVRALADIKAEASAQEMAELEEKRRSALRYICRRNMARSKRPAEDLWSAILAAQVKMEEAKECFLDLHEMAWELVKAEQKRAKRDRGRKIS